MNHKVAWLKWYLSGMHPVLADITAAAEGLLFRSESEAPFEVVEWREEKPEVMLPRLSGQHDGTFMETTSLDHFFRNMIRTYPGYSEEQCRNAKQFEALRNKLQQHLQDVLVYRIGSIQVTAFIIGRLPDGSYGGLKTKLVET
jgi:hypothetical protein